LYFGEILSLLTAFAWSAAVVLFKKSGETVHPLALNLFKDLAAVGLFVVTIAVMGGNPFPSAPIGDYLILLLSGAIGVGISDTLFFRSLNILGASVSSIVDCTYTPFVVLFSIFLLGEPLSGWQTVGIMLIIGSVLIVALTPGDIKTIIPRKENIKGWVLGISSMLLNAFSVVLAKPVLLHSSVLWVTEIRLIGGLIMLAVLFAFNRDRLAILKTLNIKTGRIYLYSSTFLGAYVAMILWLGGMKFAATSVAAALNQTNTVLIFLLAVIFLKEPLTKRLIIGLTVAVIGSYVVTFGF